MITQNHFSKKQRTIVTLQRVELSKKDLENKINTEYEILNEIDNSKTFDIEDMISCGSIKDIRGHKGHISYFSKSTIRQGKEFQYFEITIDDLSYNIEDYINRSKLESSNYEYYEGFSCNVKPNIRIGITHAKNDLELPVGSQSWSYGYRVKDGVLVNDGKYFYGNHPANEGDIIGIYVLIRPPKPDFLKESTDSVEKNNECLIKFSLNGVPQPQVVKGLYEGDYHLVVSAYNFARCRLNCGPTFKYESPIK